MLQLPWLELNSTLFPPTDCALDKPNGLLAVGGDLSEQRLLSAYRQGIFPWFSDGEPILWWTPSPRMVLFPDKLHVSRSLRKTLRQGDFQVTVNHCFSEVIQACAEPRPNNDKRDRGTWITDTIKDAYIHLHQNGYAHSFETWHERQLVGGLYGVAIGRVFFGESMFSRIANSSKIAFTHMAQLLKKWRYRLIDCQMYSNHLCSLGAEEIKRSTFETIIKASVGKEPLSPHWQPADITDVIAHSY